jgi:sulfide:quinone oxidoreductase
VVLPIYTDLHRFLIIVKTSTSDSTYDFLIVALGADLAPEAIPGFVEGGYEFYSLQGAEKLYPLKDSYYRR